MSKPGKAARDPRLNSVANSVHAGVLLQDLQRKVIRGSGGVHVPEPRARYNDTRQGHGAVLAPQKHLENIGAPVRRDASG